MCARLVSRCGGRAGGRLTAWLWAGAAQPPRAHLLAARLLALAEYSAAADALVTHAEETTFSLNRVTVCRYYDGLYERGLGAAIKFFVFVGDSYW